MAISDLSVFSVLKARMSWLQKRQDVLAENVANADTPGYGSRDLKPLDLSAYVDRGSRLAPMRTSSNHMSMASLVNHEPKIVASASFETTPSGNTVGLEEEMMKVSQTQLDYQLASGLYTRGIGLLKTALGRA